MYFSTSSITYQNGKQVILTSDKAPVDMQDIEQRLLSFQMGIVCRSASTRLRDKNFYLEKYLVS
jgi:chromosomal replication initiation ATPase DnaA